ncbi:MAG: VCBS repeat-containing protein [Nanoarchaeota archaeon]|nr:VCBS repeat-containing protein [Nanoarchaeota archaeon]MBU0962787.1 VCBS repeat-containing protein [Nanoarchaeota archaeon]
MRLITLLIILVILAGSANAVIKSDASIVLINDNEAKFISLDYENGVYTSNILKQSKFFDWKDLTLADLDGDNYNELIAIRDIGQDVYIYDFINNELSQRLDPKNIGSFAKDLEWVKMIPINLDKDKDDEILLLNNRYGRFYVIDRNGNEFNVQLIGESNNVLYNDWISMDSADIDIDGKPEIILLRKNIQPIYIIKYSNGELTKWTDAKKLGDVIGDVGVNAMTVGDLNNDGKPEIIVGGSDGKIYSVSYSNVVTILTQSTYKKIIDMDIADVDHDGKNELVLLKSERNPISIYKLVGDTFIEKVVTNFVGESGWFSVSAGKFVNEVPEEIAIEIPIEPVKEIINDLDSDSIPDESDNCLDIYNPNQLDSDQNNIGDVCEKEIVVEKNSNAIYFVIVLLIIMLAILVFFLIKPKIIQSENKSKDNKILDNDEKESMWPVSKSLKDLTDIKDFIKKTKK